MRTAVIKFRSGNELDVGECNTETLRFLEEKISSSADASSLWLAVGDSALVNLAGADYVELQEKE